MAIYFGLAAFIFLFGIVYKANSSERRKRNFIIVSFGLLIIVAGLRSPSVGIDLAGHYAKSFDLVSSYAWKEIPAFATLTGYEIGYCYFTKLISCISTDVQVFIMVSAIVMYGIMGLFIYKKSKDVVMSTELFICMCVYYMYMSMMRQGMAVSFVLLGYLLLEKHERKLKGYIWFVLMILLATTFHASAILCLIMILSDRLRFTKKQIFIMGAATIVVYFCYSKIYNVVLAMLGQGNNYERYLTSSTESVGNMNLQSMTLLLLTVGAFLLGFYVFVWKKRGKVGGKTKFEIQMEKDESFLLYMGLLASVCRLLIFQMNIINRFSYYFVPFVFILYPNAINKFSLRSNRKTLRLIVYTLFAIYFVGITVLYAGQFYGVVPFSFYWE